MKNKEHATNLLDAAVDYLDRGFSIIPVSVQNKRSLLNWKEYQNRRMTLNEIERHFKNADPAEVGIAIITGKISGLAVLDFDSQEAIAYGKEHGLFETLLVKTGKGFHAYYVFKEGLRNFQNRADLPGLDLRAEGGYVIAPPSMHNSGKQYQWVEGHSLDDLPLTDGPWDLLFGGSDEEYEQRPLDELGQGVNEGERNISLARLVGAWLHDGLTFDGCLKEAFEWSEKLESPLADGEVRRIVKSISSTHNRNTASNEGIKSFLSFKSVGGEPINFDQIDTPDIPANLLPVWLGEYAEALSTSTQTPEALSVMLALSVVATSLQRRFEVSPYNSGYREPLSLWTASVLPPASRKTAVLSAITEPLVAWEKDRESVLKDKISEITTTRQINAERIKKMESEAAKEDSSLKRDHLIKEISKIKENTPEEIILPRLWTGDVTPERLQNLMAEHGERMALLSDEGGIFEIMSGLYSGGRANIDTFLQAHAGRAVRVDRGGRTVTLDKPALTFGLAVQPQIISDLSQGGKKRFRGNGTLARFLYAVPKNNIGYRNVLQHIPVPNIVEAKFLSGICALLSIPDIENENGDTEPRVLTLDKEALALWQGFAAHIEENLREGGELEVIQGWGGKLAGAALRIAGLLHVVEFEQESLIIGEGTMERSVVLCDLLAEHAKAAFSLMGDDQATKDAKHVLKWIQTEEFSELKKSDCHQKFHGRFRKVERLEKALLVLQHRYFISEPFKRNRAGRGRPSIVFSVNPQLSVGKKN